MTLQVLLVEDDEALRVSLAQTIELAGFIPLPTASFVQARRTIRSNFNGVILSDIRMPDQDGFDLLHFAQGVDAELPVILLTGHADVPTAMRAMKNGAWDFLEKPCSTDRLIEVLNRAVAHRELVIKTRRVERTLLRSDAAAVNFPGPSRVTDALRTAFRQVAAIRKHAHIHGSEGVGKKLAAYTINQLSPDPTAFLHVNLATAADTVFREITIPQGAVDLSCKSIGQATKMQQRDLLALLDTNPNLRVITSAQQPLIKTRARVLADELGFQDAFIEIEVPTLRARREDLPEVFEAMLRQAARSLDIDMPKISDSLAADILARDWSGNLPELRSFATSFALGQQIQSEQRHALGDQMDAFERLVLTDALRRSGGSATAAAKSLGVPRNTLYDRLGKHGLSPKDFR